jgi:hypothetical protein
MSMWYVIGATVGLVYLALCAWFMIEVITAPLVDQDDRVISDAHHRMSRPRRSRWYRRRLRSAPEEAASPPDQADGEYVVDLSNSA